jgi:hypothetical protein
MNRHQIDTRTLNRTLRLKETVIASFCEPTRDVAARLREFSASDWQKIQFWLDASGIALYLLERLTTLKLQHLLPESLLTRLQENLHNNRERTNALFEEAVTINHALQEKGIQFALLKGATLTPDSVPDNAFRTQWDLDFLVAEKDAENTLQVLQDFGYSLFAVSGMTWELKAGTSGLPDIANIYKVRPYRSLEVHLLPTQQDGTGDRRQDQLTRARMRTIRGETLCSLSPADLFLQQALHLFKHICGEYTRASWVLEYWRHVLARYSDKAFWREVKSLADDEPQADVAIGAVTLLTTHLFGEFAPFELTDWSMNRLPSAIRLWVETYGHRAVMSEFPGSKLYLLLRQQLHAEQRNGRAHLRGLIFPAHLPPKVTHGKTNKGLLARLMQYRAQANFIFLRLRFHVVEGLRYSVESPRWQRRLTGMTQ